LQVNKIAAEVTTDLLNKKQQNSLQIKKTNIQHNIEFKEAKKQTIKITKHQDHKNNN
jgi:hypothetical protein